MNIRIMSVVLFSLTCATASIACQVNEITVKNAYVLSGPADQVNTAAYAHIVNAGKEDCHLIGASSTIADRVELHTIKKVGNNMKMEPVESFLISAEGELVLAKGGNHLMFLHVKPNTLSQKTVPLTLTFDNNQTKTLNPEVRSMRDAHMHE